MTVASIFSCENSHSQNDVIVLGHENSLLFAPQFTHSDDDVISLFIHSLHTLCTTHKLGLCSIDPHQDLLQFTHLSLTSGRYPSWHSKTVSCVHSRSKNIYLACFCFFVFVVDGHYSLSTGCM